MPKSIYEAAYDGELTTVKTWLAQNPQLLDRSFKEDCLGLIGVPVSNVAFGLKKILGGVAAIFTLCFIGIMTAETAGVAIFFIFLSGAAAKGFWYGGDTAMQYYMTNINNWTPLDCAVFGYINGNESAFGVAEYLMQQGANGAVALTQPDKRLFETFGNSQIEVLWRREQASRTQRQQNNQLAQDLQQRLKTENTSRVALLGMLAKKEQEDAALATQVDNINVRLGQLRPLEQTAKYTLFMLPHGAANPGAAAQQAVPQI